MSILHPTRSQGLRLRLDSEAGETVDAMNEAGRDLVAALLEAQDRKSTRLNSSHSS